MKYRAHFSLVYLQNRLKEVRHHFCVEFAVDDFEMPGGVLRTIAHGEFECQGADGLSIGDFEVMEANSVDDFYLGGETYKDDELNKHSRNLSIAEIDYVPRSSFLGAE